MPQRHHVLIENEELELETLGLSRWERIKHSTKYYYGRMIVHLIIFKNLIPYLWPKNRFILRCRVVASMIFLILSKVSSVGTPFFYKAVIDGLMKAEEDHSGLTKKIILFVCLYGAGKVATSIFSDGKDALFVDVSQHALKEAALDVYSHIHTLSIGFHLKRKTGSVLRAIDRGTRSISFLTQSLLFNFFPILVEVSFVTIIMSAKYILWIPFITLCCVLFYLIFTLAVTEWRTKFRRMINKADNEANDKALDSLINFQTVKYFSREDHEIRRYEVAVNNYNDAQVKARWSLAFLNIGQTAIIAFGQFIVMLISAFQVGKERMSVGDLVLVNTMLLQLYIPLNFLGSSYRMIKQSLIDIEQMFDLLKEEPLVKDLQYPEDMLVSKGEIEFIDVHFTYPNTEREILKGVSFKVEAGSKLAIVGPTAAGKSSILRLLLRFYDVDAGQILIDGIDISEVKQRDLREVIGVIPQDTVLFNDTLRYNIQYGDLGASEEELQQAVDIAQLRNTIESLDDGLETIVGERGLKLSGGELQRVSIARAVLKKAPLLLADEATSSLDSTTEAKIMDCINEVSKNATTILIAHRLSTICNADQIVVLEEGQIRESGNHSSLMEIENGLYRELWLQQSQHDSDVQ